MSQDFQGEAQPHGLPMRRVTFGEEGIAQRGQGVGSEWAQTCMDVARALSHPSLYAGTATAHGLLLDAGQSDPAQGRAVDPVRLHVGSRPIIPHTTTGIPNPKATEDRP